MLKFTKYVVDNSKVKQVLFSKTKFFLTFISDLHENYIFFHL